jgi:SAM-dependent methyltransferase
VASTFPPPSEHSISTYEDYSRAAADYDASRVAVGIEIVLGALQAGGIAPATAHVLDLGCGTGAYAAALAPHLGRMTLLDASEGMLAEAEATLAGLDDTCPYEVHEGSLLDLPFGAGAFDAVVVNQVLHHLGDEEGGAWTGHTTVLAEVARVLRPGGVLVVNTCSQTQLRRAYWYYALVPVAADALRRRYAGLDGLEAAMDAVELVPAGRFVPGAILQGPSYLDGRSPLDPVWRNGDSVWSLASDDELAAALDRVRALDEAGTLAAFVAEHDRLRADLGQVTFVTARRL